MNQDKLNWCCKQKRGIELIEPSNNLSDTYIDESNKTLESIDKIDNKWNLIMGYYACYNALYSILMKAGIKSEIHDCSIALMETIPGFSDEDVTFLKKLKEDRINVQYYLKDKKLEDKNAVKAFIMKCKQIKDELDINSFREKISTIKKGDEN